ncbi:unnamed protein product [Effrenium voratum]|uniref:Methyltransferase type 11 domain-containing protein n=1 Tax=Effrenium voratum TaxID=2562239 RepID=A0AA36JHF7_9DINO|nr:unnamed protein product [Effrenium voratum]CAJ1429904.1 unnamed protein product [Effrenium voratum]
MCGCFQFSKLRDLQRRFALFRGDSARSWLGRREYWEAAYASGRYKDVYEWNQTCDAIWPYVTKMLGQSFGSRVLHVGCGNSRLGRTLHDAGFVRVTNVDYSDAVIEMMRRQEPQLTWLCVDCAAPGALGADCFDFCIDKGAIDSLFESNTKAMWENGCSMVREIHRALIDGGKYLVISNGGVGIEILRATFRSVEVEHMEGYACDLYYKLITVILCTK